MIQTLCFLVLVPLFSGCGAYDGSSAVVRIGLPASLTETRPRYGRFLSRVRYLELRATEADGTTHERRVPAAEWDSLSLGDWAQRLVFSDSWKLQAKVWDLTSRGEIRSYPALQGEVTVRHDELAPGKQNVIPLKLSLKVSVREYD